jgi:hypothetical protein
MWNFDFAAAADLASTTLYSMEIQLSELHFRGNSSLSFLMSKTTKLQASSQSDSLTTGEGRVRHLTMCNASFIVSFLDLEDWFSLPEDSLCSKRLFAESTRCLKGSIAGAREGNDFDCKCHG